MEIIKNVFFLIQEYLGFVYKLIFNFETGDKKNPQK